MSYDHSKIVNIVIAELSKEKSYKSVCHPHFKDHKMPSLQALEEIVSLSRKIIFPGYFGNSSVRPDSVNYFIGVNIERLNELLAEQICAGLCFMSDDPEKFDINEGKRIAHDYAIKFIEKLPDLRHVLSTDVEAIYLGDPAAKSKGEVIFCYPAIRAITNYRVANALLNIGVTLIPRMITEMAHSETGIDIHPRASIGSYFSIDHGTGVVIGATSIIGNNVKIYQGVTLGAKSFPLDEKGNPIKGIPRHPIIEDDVVIYAQATILGRITIGSNSVIGGNIWVTNSVEPNSKIVQFKPRDIYYGEGGGI